MCVAAVQKWKKKHRLPEVCQARALPMPQHHLEVAGPAEIPCRELRAAGMCSSADKGVAGRESGQGTGDGYRWGATPNR